MTEDELRAEVRAFFDEFVRAFRSFDGGQIARLYMSQCCIVNDDGTADFLKTNADTARRFRNILDDYYREGCRSCRYRDFEAIPIGSRSALGTVTWELMREDGSVIRAWRESYNLVHGGDRWRVLTSIDHAGG